MTAPAPTAALARSLGADPDGRPGRGPDAIPGERGRRVTGAHAAAWCGAAVVAVLVTLVVVDNFVVVELRLPLATVTARLGWIVVCAALVGFAAGWVVGRFSRRPAGVGTRPWRPGPIAGG